MTSKMCCASICVRKSEWARVKENASLKINRLTTNVSKEGQDYRRKSRINVENKKIEIKIKTSEEEIRRISKVKSKKIIRIAKYWKKL